MPRQPRFVFPEVPHHIKQRGNNRDDVFFSDQDRLRHLQILGEHGRRHASAVSVRFGIRLMASPTCWRAMLSDVELIGALQVHPEVGRHAEVLRERRVRHDGPLSGENLICGERSVD